MQLTRLGKCSIVCRWCGQRLMTTSPTSPSRMSLHALGPHAATATDMMHQTRQSMKSAQHVGS